MHSLTQARFHSYGRQRRGRQRTSARPGARLASRVRGHAGMAARCRCVCVCVPAPICHSSSVSLLLFLFLCLSMYVSLLVPLSLPLFVSVCLSLLLRVCLCLLSVVVCLSLSLCFSMSLSLSLFLWLPLPNTPQQHDVKGGCCHAPTHYPDRGRAHCTGVCARVCVRACGCFTSGTLYRQETEKRRETHRQKKQKTVCATCSCARRRRWRSGSRCN